MMELLERAHGRAHRTPLYSAPRGPSPLRVVLVSPPEVPRWLAEFVVDGIAGHGLVLETVRIAPADAPAAGRPSSRLPLDLRVFLAIEPVLSGALGRLAGQRLPGALARVPLPPHGGGAGAAHADRASLLADVHARKPDLVLLHAPDPAGLAEAFAPVARHGCWVLDGDLVDPVSAGLSFLAPVLEGDEATAVTLHLVPARGGGEASEVLSDSLVATSAMSFSRQRDNAFAKLPALLSRALRGLAGAAASAPGGVHHLRFAPPTFAPVRGMGTRSFLVGAREFLDWRSRRARARLPWFLLLPEAGTRLDPSAPRLGRCASLVAPGRDYWADPYPVDEGGRRLIFAEELVHARGKGTIVCLELLDDGSAIRHGIVVEEDAHLSYPQVFRWEGAWYMTVESCEADRVSLYRAEEFPMRWQRIADLIQGRRAVDPTLHHEDGTWYLFANISESGAGQCDELFLFTSDRLAGPYRPHPCNPIDTDARTSRPAGRLFRHGDTLVRPSQCCVPIYGSAVVFNEVLEMTPERYRERPMARLAAGAVPELDGYHTYNSWRGFEALDAHGVPPGAASRMPLAPEP